MPAIELAVDGVKALNVVFLGDDSIEEIHCVIASILLLVDEAGGITITFAMQEMTGPEIWDVPEYRAFCRTLVAEGFLGIAKCPVIKDDTQYGKQGRQRHRHFSHDPRTFPQRRGGGKSTPYGDLEPTGDRRQIGET